MGLSDSSSGRTASACTLYSPLRSYPLRSRSLAFNAFLSLRAVPATPREGDRLACRTSRRHLLPSPVL